MKDAGAQLEHQEVGKNVIDALSVATVLGTLADVLPSLAALLSIIWTALRIAETKTVRGWFGKGGGDAAD